MDLEKVNKVLKALKPIDIKQGIEKSNFSLFSYKSPNIYFDINNEKTVTKKEVEEMIDDKFEDIIDNIKKTIDSDNESQKEISKIPSERDLTIYFINAASGTAVTASIQPDFLNKGGIVFPLSSEISPPDFLINNNQSLVSIEVKKNNNNEINFKSNFEKPSKKWFSMDNPFIWIISTLIVLIISFYILKYFK